MRSRQSNALQIKIRTICHGDTMSRQHPAIAPQVLEQVAKCCGLQTTDAEFRRFDEVTYAIQSAIRNLCFSDTARRSLGQ